MGGPCAVESFGRAYSHPVEEWSEQLRETLDSEEFLRAECPILGLGEVDLSSAKYAGDLAKLHIGGGAASLREDAALE
eukprot:5617255-Pyramimonas_sp.AAC.1